MGASHKPERPSYKVLEFLLAEGFNVTPVNPGLAGQELQGQTVVASLSDIDHAIDMVDVFRDGSALPGILSDTIALGAPLCGHSSRCGADAEREAIEQGLDLVVDKCPLQELPRLRSRGLI